MPGLDRDGRLLTCHDRVEVGWKSTHRHGRAGLKSLLLHWDRFGVDKSLRLHWDRLGVG
jgi:hypothetical protein